MKSRIDICVKTEMKIQLVLKFDFDLVQKDETVSLVCSSNLHLCFSVVKVWLNQKTSADCVEA